MTESADGFALQLQQAARVDQKDLAILGQAELTAGAMYQRTTYALFQGANALADGRLRLVQLPGGRRESPILDHRHEGAEQFGVQDRQAMPIGFVDGMHRNESFPR